VTPTRQPLMSVTGEPTVEASSGPESGGRELS
jgi:hypothetical protein